MLSACPVACICSHKFTLSFKACGVRHLELTITNFSDTGMHRTG